MINKSPKPFLILCASALLLLSLPKQGSEKIRGMAIAALSPAWETLISVKHHIGFFFGREKKKKEKEIYLQKLELTNHHLQRQVSRLEKLLLQEQLLGRQIAQFKGNRTLKALQKAHKEQLEEALSMELKAIPAEVIFRPPSTWNSSLWVNVGKEENEKLGTSVIAKNSPVVVGDSVIGVVDYVGQKQSRVRLITDSGLTPSVRVLRGDLQKIAQEERVAALIDEMVIRDNERKESEEMASYYEMLTKLQNQLKRRKLQEGSWLLAKGELHGNSEPLWRSLGTHLKGIGFNYDFDDEIGPARDLRPSKTTPEAVEILKKEDLLVTTGMDGVFPAGLKVAEVTHVKLLREGDYYYELEAMPTAGDLREVSVVFIMPSVGFDPTDQP